MPPADRGSPPGAHSSGSYTSMELPLAPGPYSPRRLGGSTSLSPAESEGGEYSEQARLVSSALSDDGRTPLIKPARTRRQQVAHWSKTLLQFLLAHWYKAAIVAVIITLIVLVSVKGFAIFGDILRWFQQHNGWAGWGCFIGLYTAMVALFLPGVVLILGAGFVFGFWRGLLAVWAGGAVGQALAFLLARYLLRDWVEATVRGKWRTWEYIDKAIEHDGWKLVLIMRFSPVIPYNLLNLAMATTSIPFWQFALVSAVGIVYECAVFAYLGSMAENISSIISGDAGPPPVIEWVLLGVSAVMCVLGAVFVSYTIKRAVRKAEARMSTTDAGPAGTADGELEGVLLHPTYPASLEREGFFGGSSPYRGVDSPSFELRAVSSSLPEAARLANGSNGGSSSLKEGRHKGSNNTQGLQDGSEQRKLRFGAAVPGSDAFEEQPILDRSLRRRSSSLNGDDVP